MYQVTNLFVKSKKGQPLTAKQYISCDKNFGIIGNISGGPDNPRQILISCQDDLNIYNLKPGQLRENICISSDICQKLESGDLVYIGNKVKIRITYPCEPCGHLLDLENFGIDKMQGFEPHRGKLGYVINGGNIYIGDVCVITKNQYLKFPNETKKRFEYIYNLIPEDQIIDYTTMTMLMGVASGYVRAMPKYISNIPGSQNKVISKENYIFSNKVKRNYSGRLDN